MAKNSATALYVSVGLILVVLGLLSPTGIVAVPVAAHAQNGRSVSFASTRVAPSPGAANDVWLEFQHDTNNSGRSSNPPVASTLAWNFSLPTVPSGALTPSVGSPVSGYGNVYIPEGNAIFAYNASEGTPVWNRTLTPNAGGGQFVVDETPLLWNGWLIVSQDYQTPQGPNHPACGARNHCSYVYIMDARTGLNLGSFAPDAAGALWSGNLVPSSPIPLGPDQFSGHSGFLLLDDAGYAYTFEWNGTAIIPVGSSVAAVAGYGVNERTTSTPAVAYVPGAGWAAISLDAANNVVDALNLSNASTLPYLTGYPLTVHLGGPTNIHFAGGTESSSVAVVNISTPGGNYPVAFFGDNDGGAGTSHLVAVNLSNVATPLLAVTPLSATGATNDGTLSAPAVVPINSTSVGLIINDLNGSVSRWNYSAPAGGTPSFSLAWEESLGAAQTSAGSPAIAGDTVYVANSTGTVFALNVSTGAPSWHANTTSDIRSSFALAYDRLYVFSDPLFGTGAELSAYGAAAPPVIKLGATRFSPDPVGSGMTTTMTVNVTTGPALGTQTPAVGATVDATFPLGTPLTQSAVSNASGTATFSWKAPPYSPVNYTVRVNLSANLTGAGSTTGSATVGVLAGGSTGSGLSAMSGVLTPVNSSISPGQTVSFTLAVTNATGVAVPGASTTITLSGPGTLTTPPAITGSNGKTTFVVTASANLATSQAILVSADITAPQFAHASAAAVIEVSVSPVISPPGASPLSARITPGTLAVWEGNVSSFSVTVVNATSSKPIAGASVNLTLSSGTGSTVSPATASTNSAGVANFSLTAGSVPGAVLITAVVRATNYTATSAFASLSVIAKPSSSPAPKGNATTTSSSSISPEEILLIGLVVLLVIALALALTRRREPPSAAAEKTSPPSEEKETSTSKETPADDAEKESKGPEESSPPPEPQEGSPSEEPKEPSGSTESAAGESPAPTPEE